ncbi:MAG: 5-aminopentanamidase [Candidatus Sumerlaeota bacterium]|nr:5-aminopentanamidase [Candidatus Sumerlaeota bacterium]
MTPARIGYIQYKPEFGDRTGNLARLEALCRQAAPADLLVLPELAATGYEFLSPAEVRPLAEPFGDGPTFDLCGRLARELNATLVAGYPESAGERLYNAAFVALPDGTFANYRKIHLFSREKELFSPGDAPPLVVETPLGRIGVMICFDWLFPETAHSLAIRGARILCHPSNLVLPGFCQKAMLGRCIENRVFAVTANRWGVEERVGRRLRFTGLSQVVDPRGNVLLAAPEEADHLGVVEIDPALADDKQVTEHNHLFADRRPDLYEGLG